MVSLRDAACAHGFLPGYLTVLDSSMKNTTMFSSLPVSIIKFDGEDGLVTGEEITSTNEYAVFYTYHRSIYPVCVFLSSWFLLL